MPSHNPLYKKHEDASINSFEINHINLTSDDSFSTSTRNYQTETLKMLNQLNIPSPYKIGRPHSPCSFNSDHAFSPLFENLSSQGSAYDCLSASTGDFLLRSPSIMSETPYRLEKMHVPILTDTTLDPMDNVPFLSHSNELDSRTNPRASLLYYADANLDDRVNGPIRMRNLPSCVDTSITAASFCLRYISSSAATQACIRDLINDHLQHLFRELFPLLSIGSETIDSHGNIKYIQCLQYTSNRTVNLVTDNMTSEQLSPFPNGPPSTFHDLMLNHLSGSLGHQYSLSILYTFKMSYQCHFVISSHIKNDVSDYLPPNLTNIVRNVPTFATALCLFPNRSYFRDIAAFIHTFFKDKQVSTNPLDKKQEKEYNKQDQELPSHSVLITMIAFMHSPLVNGFGHPTLMYPQTS